MDGTGLRDILVDLINTNTRRVLHAEPVETPLSRDRHAIDITDDRGNVWRVDAHNHPRNQAEVAS